MIRRILEESAREMGVVVPAECISAFEQFAVELKKWNKKINLTALKSDTEIAVKHILDSLFFAGYIGNDERVLDIGSGAGVPAIPLKIVKPEVFVVSVDAVAKKINFQRHIARTLRFNKFEALHSRAEDLQKTHFGCFDVITSRAFSSLEQFVMLAKPFLAVGGRMIAMKGPAVGDEMAQAAVALEMLELEIVAVYTYALPFNCGERRLVEIVHRVAA